MKKFIAVAVLALSSLTVVSAKTYEIILSSRTKAGSVQLKPGQYTLKVNGNKVRFEKIEIAPRELVLGTTAEVLLGEWVPRAEFEEESKARSAAQTEAAFKAHATPFYKRHMGDIMESKRNAVLVWTTAPTQQQINDAMGCLGS